ncbi:MAG: hypothetical protein PUD50_00600 [Eubacteriales bacterium]|nr:hypothetical protein [Eubacteriales bacterium]
MRYLIGYQCADELDSTSALVRDFSKDISGVYFSLPGAPSARSAVEPSRAEDMFRELRDIASMGKRLVLLYNANCYGPGAASSAFAEKIRRETAFVRKEFGVKDVTTASPFVARVLQDAFGDMDVCASVNMRVGSVQAMELLTDFNSFYLQREHLHDMRHIARLKAWCGAHGKELRLIANSGCLYDCPFHTYHDNLVAHESEISEPPQTEGFPSPCWACMHRVSEEQAAALFLQGNWIRPEDMEMYAPYFSEAKLATRMHAVPRRVVSAYVRGRFHGNLLDLTEPAFSTRFHAHILDATLIPADYFRHRDACGHQCETCGYCMEIARRALRRKADMEREFLHTI